MSNLQDEIINQISTLLKKHLIYNEPLIYELAILMLEREKSVMEQSHRITKEVIGGIGNV